MENHEWDLIEVLGLDVALGRAGCRIRSESIEDLYAKAGSCWVGGKK
jgi:hypothetical protein